MIGLQERLGNYPVYMVQVGLYINPVGYNFSQHAGAVMAHPLPAMVWASVDHLKTWIGIDKYEFILALITIILILSYQVYYLTL
jgi:hypothetical protein